MNALRAPLMMVDRRDHSRTAKFVAWANALPSEAVEPVVGLGALGVGAVTILGTVEFHDVPPFLRLLAENEADVVMWGLGMGLFGMLKIASYMMRWPNPRRFVALAGLFLWTMLSLGSIANFRYAGFAAGFCPALALSSLFLVFKLGRIERAPNRERIS